MLAQNKNMISVLSNNMAARLHSWVPVARWREVSNDKT